MKHLMVLQFCAGVILAVTACNGSSGGSDMASGDVAFRADHVQDQDISGRGDMLPQQDLKPGADLSADDLAVETPDLGGPDEANDLGEPDVVEPDLPKPEEVTDYDANAVAEKAYSKCETDADCPAPLTCQTGRNNPLYGQCTLDCTANEQCPAAPFGNEVGCVYNMCVSVCGIHGGTCPDWLECVSQEFCLEPVSTEATLGTGKSCTEAAECIQPAECVQGEVTKPYCAPLCTTNEDCLAAAPEAYGQCASGGGFNFCMFYCGMMGQNKPCPGDMTCEVVICR